MSALQTKAAALLNILIVATPGSFLVSATSVGNLDGITGVIAFLVLVAGNISLALGLLLAGLATGLLRSIEVVITKLETPAQPLEAKTAKGELTELRLREIRALNNSAAHAMRTTGRLAEDLYAARRFAIGGAFVFAIGLMLAWTSR